jgi:hypothetical protein
MVSRRQKREPEEDHQGKSQGKEEQNKGSRGTEPGRQQTCQPLTHKSTGSERNAKDEKFRSQKRKKSAESRHHGEESEDARFSRLDFRPDKLQDGYQPQSGWQQENAQAEQPDQGVGKIRAESADEIMDRTFRGDEVGEGGILWRPGEKTQEKKKGRGQTDDAMNFMVP